MDVETNMYMLFIIIAKLELKCIYKMLLKLKASPSNSSNSSSITLIKSR